MKKGRNPLLIQKRDEALVRRYYYWTETQRLRFDDALKVLSDTEFFISEQCIMNIIRRYAVLSDKGKRKGVPKVKKPKITKRHLDLLRTDTDNDTEDRQ